MDSSTWDERYAASDLVWSVKPNTFVETECADLTPGRAVDLAAGEGRNAIWLASRGWQVTAVDFSQVALDKGRSMVPEAPISWERADATTWQSPTTYDLVVVAYLQLPPTERTAAMRNAFDALVPGGTFFLVGHDTTNYTEGTGGPTDPGVLYTAEDVLSDLADRPFETVRAERVERNVPGEHRATGMALDCLVRLVRTT